MSLLTSIRASYLTCVRFGRLDVTEIKEMRSVIASYHHPWRIIVIGCGKDTFRLRRAPFHVQVQVLEERPETITAIRAKRSGVIQHFVEIVDTGLDLLAHGFEQAEITSIQIVELCRKPDKVVPSGGKQGDETNAYREKQEADVSREFRHFFSN